MRLGSIGIPVDTEIPIFFDSLPAAFAAGGGLLDVLRG
jgi:hypothetical protein